MSYMVQNLGRGSNDDCTPPLRNRASWGSRWRGSVHCELILPHTWHIPKIPLSLEGEEGTGAEPAAWRSARHLLAVALQLAAPALHSTGGQLALGSATAFSEQFYLPIYSRYSNGECFVAIFPRETVKYRQFSNIGLNG